MRTHIAADHRHRANPMRTVQPLSTRSAAVVARTEELPTPNASMMSDINGNDLQLLRKEFHAFWSSGLRGRDYVDQSAIVCYLDLDEEEITLTRIFHCTGDDLGEERAEDLMIDWFQEDTLIQKATTIEMSLYMNYSPLRLTVDGLVMVFNELKAMGKKVKASIKFVELYKTDPGEEDSEENREGLRILQRYGVKLDMVKERDWLYLMQTLTKNSAKEQQEERNAAARQRLTQILRDPHDEGTSTCDCDGNVQLVREADLITILHKETVAKQQPTKCEGILMCVVNGKPGHHPPQALQSNTPEAV